MAYWGTDGQKTYLSIVELNKEIDSSSASCHKVQVNIYCKYIL